jgi:biopolymer transport protein ExbD
MKVSKSAEVEEVRVELVPLIDCVFLLLIFFMCCASLTTKDSPTDVRLPVASNGAEQKDPSHRGTVNILPPGSRGGGGQMTTVDKPFVVFGNVVDEEGLQRAMEEQLKIDPVMKLYLRADRAVKFAVVRKAMAACAAAGVQDVVFATYLQDLYLTEGK